jgi:hypothetical protein
LRFWRHLLEARLLRSLMRRYFWSPEQPGSLVMDDSEQMLKLEETLRHRPLKMEKNMPIKHRVFHTNCVGCLAWKFIYQKSAIYILDMYGYHICQMFLDPIAEKYLAALYS